MKKIVELLIDWDNIEFDELGVDIMSLVDKPAIQTSWLAFNAEGEMEIHECDFNEETILSSDEEQRILEIAEAVGEYVDYKESVFIDINKSEFTTIGDFLKGVSALDILGRRVKKDQEAETKYRYAGPAAERNFCKAMQRLNKIYTREEIDQMESRGLNRQLGHNQQPYSIFDFKGGVNCKHYWEELSVFRAENGQLVMISHGPARGRAGETANSSNNYWRFSDEDQRIITGPAMIPDRLILRRDEMGNPFHVYFSKETIRKIAEKFLKNAAHNTDINHNDEVTTENTLLESWIVDDPQYDKSTKLGFNVPQGTWMVSYRINDTATWQQIKNGELNGFSVTGNFIEKLQK